MKAFSYLAIAAIAAGAGSLGGQTTGVDLTRQGKLGSGTQLPGQCTVGQIFLQTTAAPGANVFVCNAANVWKAIGLPALGGDATGTATAVAVSGIQGRKVSASSPQNQDVFQWNATAGEWEPGPLYTAGNGVALTGRMIGLEDAIVPIYYAGQGAPTLGCNTGRDFYIDSSGLSLYYCKGPNQWQQVSNAGHTHSADALTSGTLAEGLLPATVVRNGQDNLFGAGRRQSVTHDATNAGLRLIPAAGDPSNVQDGDVWYNLTSGKFRRRQNGAVSDWDPPASINTTQANTYSAGQRQSMTHDGANAGLRLVPAAGDPSSAQDGDVWYNLTTGKFRRRQGGTVVDWDVTGGISTTQANTYSAGQRQSMTHDGTNAGLRLVPAAGDPSSAQDGDVWYNLTTGKFRRRQGGTVVDWDVTGGISTTQANTYSAGQRQSMTHDGANAGLRLVPAAGDPSSAQDGDVWYNLTTGKFRRRQGGTVVDWDATGGGGSSYDPNDTSTFMFVEEFPPRLFNSGNFGTHGWYAESIGSGGCALLGLSGGLPNNPGLATLVAPNTASTGCSATLDAGGDTRMLGNLSGATFEARWTMVPDGALATTNLIARFGLGATSYSTASMTGWMTRIDPAAGSTIFFDLYTAGTLTGSVSSGVTYNPNATSYTFKLRGDGSKWYLSVSSVGGSYSTEKTACPSGCDITGALPTSSLTPFASIQHGATTDAIKRVYLDRFSIKVSGLAR